ncbi:MAG: tyrosine-type recombinase/integrase [Campylobacterales bacterium]|nr:tyrosine-type recombinase/integrase [Campylobacterales bacterium]
MPFDSKQWQRVKYRGGYLIGIKQHKDDTRRFMFEVNIKTIRRRMFAVIDAKGAERYILAMDKYATFKADIRSGYFITGATFGEMFARMLAVKDITQKWRKMQESTYRNHIAPYLGDMNLQDIRPHHIDAVKAKANGNAPATIKGIIAIVKATHRQAQEEKIIKTLPLEPRHDVKVIASQQKTIVTDATGKFKAVHDAIVMEFIHDPTIKGVFLFGLNGRRKAEVLRMRWEHIDFNTMQYIIPSEHSKIKTNFSFSLTCEIADTLQKIKGKRRGLIFKNPNTGKEYSNIQSQIERVRKVSGWDGFTFHTMRNLLTSMLHSQGVSASYMSSQLGHTNPNTVLQYLSMERVQPIIETVVNAVIHGSKGEIITAQ